MCTDVLAIILKDSNKVISQLAESFSSHCAIYAMFVVLK